MLFCTSILNGFVAVELLPDRQEMPVWHPSNRLLRMTRSPWLVSETQSSRVSVDQAPSMVVAAWCQMRMPSTAMLSVRGLTSAAGPESTVLPAPLQHCFRSHHVWELAKLPFTLMPE